MIVLLFLATCFLAYSNGANDNFKGVASLFGSGAATYRQALAWATATTFAGSIAALFLAQGLLAKFSGKGIVPENVTTSPNFLFAVAVGAGLTVILATLTGFPVSTTHGLTGAIVGSGLVAVGTRVDFSTLGKAFVLPLLLSPVLAVGVGACLYLVLRFVRLKTGVTKEWCLCVGQEEQVLPIPQPNSVIALQAASPMPSVAIGEMNQCKERYRGTFLGIGSQRAVDVAHFFSAGAVSFARGLNDTPKMAALLLVVKALDIRWGMMALAVAIAVGGLLNSKKIAETMSHKITSLNTGQGFSANLTTAILVFFASKYGLPVSTTHVSVGSLFGIGLTSKQANFKVISGILLSWVLTLPCAALLSALVYWCVTHLN